MSSGGTSGRRKSAASAPSLGCDAVEGAQLHDATGHLVHVDLAIGAIVAWSMRRWCRHRWSRRMLIGNGATVANRRFLLPFRVWFMFLGSVVASHGVVATSLVGGDGPSMGVVCGGQGYPCGASHGTRGSHKAGRPRISERCISQGPRIDDDVAYVEGGDRPRSRAWRPWIVGHPIDIAVRRARTSD